ncbi:4Fe-4S dicluster domain-containing protein [bacterium]|nr:4Fe-4S dicluster domain-containing protein [bacterium]
MRYPKIRELGEAVKSLLSKPYTSSFPKTPHEPFDGFRGKPEHSEEFCVGCGACAESCPGNAIAVIDPDPKAKNKKPLMRKLELKYEKCNFCGICEANCITEKGITLTKQFDLALFDRNLARESIELELVTCELCGDIVTTKKHLLWIFRKLGVLAYGNPTLLLTAQREMLPVESGGAGEELRRPDIFKVLCPKCRKDVMMKDIYG